MKFVSFKDIPDIPTTHGVGTKKVIIAPNTMSNVHQFGRTEFKLGEAVTPHSHKNFAEVMWVESGEAEMTVDEKSFPIVSGDCITVEVGETHAITVTKEPFVLFFFAVYK